MHFSWDRQQLARPSKKPIENLRPQHILDALFWPELPKNDPVLFEESDATPSRYYVLTQLRRSDASLEIARKIWFDRADLRISRIEIYGPAGRLDADISYSHVANGPALQGPGFPARFTSRGRKRITSSHSPSRNWP